MKIIDEIADAQVLTSKKRYMTLFSGLLMVQN